MTSQSDFNDPFSKPIVRRRFQATLAQQSATQGIEEDQLPCVSSNDSPGAPINQLSSPPLSLPETSSEGNPETSAILQNLSSDDSEPEMSQSSTASLNKILEESSINKEEPPRQVKKSSSRGYDFDIEEGAPTAPVQKKRKEELDMGGAKFIPKHDRSKHVYTHKWINEDDIKEDEPLPSSSSSSRGRSHHHVNSSKLQKPVSVANSSHHSASVPSSSSFPNAAALTAHRSRVKHIKEANELRESGEYDDFKQDIVYILSSLQSTDASVKVKCLSAISLAKKCVSPDFRQFIKSENMPKSIVRALLESPEDDLFALAASTVLYLLTRDFNSIQIDFTSLRLVSQLLRIESMEQRKEEKEKVVNLVWEIFNAYIEKQEIAGQKVSFEIRKEDMTPSLLITEALVFICGRAVNEESFKNELLNLGILQFVVAKIETHVKKLADGGDHTLNILILTRCFRILETCSIFHKKNQAFLISHRSNVLIISLAKFLQITHERASNLPDDILKKYMSCLSLMCRLLINISHDNELCCSKLGQLDGFIPNAITTFTFLAPRFGKEDSYDINVMMTSLLTNLVERCNTNRKVVIAQTVKMAIPGKEVEEVAALEAITRLFVHHESQAQIVDADLDRELAFDEGGCRDADEEEGEDEESGEEDGVRKDGRLDRNKMDRMDQCDVVHALQQVMSKASQHMEGSVIASYHALLVGFVLQQNEGHLDDVRKHLPGNTFENMISQLKRLYDFTKTTMAKRMESNSGIRAIERVIEYLERLD